MTLTRRGFLRSAGVTAGSVAMLGGAVGWQLSGARHVGALVRSTARLPQQFTLAGRIPEVLAPMAADATTDYYQMTQRRASIEILPGYRTEIWGYNGQFPGPTLRTRRARSLSVTHRNELTVPVAVHLHGGHTPHESDGYPTDYLLPVGGTAAMLDDDSGSVVVSGEREYVFPNDQPAATLWYHDHRMDFTGASVWRGLAGFHLVHDDIEDGLSLPSGDQDLPMMLCDRAFGADGSFIYPAVDPSALDTPGVTDAFAQGVLGDVILVNGVPWPRYDVASARYRLRWLNGSNARVYRLGLHGPHSQAPGFIQIGSDGGLLDKPQHLDTIDIAPGERFDTVIDLTGYRIGDEVTITNEFGDSTTSSIVRFRVTHEIDDASRVPDVLTVLESYKDKPAVRYRDFDFRAGEMTMMPASTGGRDDAMGAMQSGTRRKGWLINGRAFDPHRADVTARLGDLEIWRLTTNFNHPIHVHLNQFQVLSRNGRAPLPSDRGWKDTINLAASEAAEIAIRFTDYPGRFLLHCHNLEHEDMGMMSNLVTVH